MKEIKVKCTGADYANIDDLIPFQGDLKDLTRTGYEKLRDNILTDGFSFPFHVWQDNENFYLLDGHQTKRTLEKLKEEGYTIPKLPIVYVEADDIKQAKKKLLTKVSQYGTLTEQGLYSFISDADITIDEVKANFDFPEIDIEHFEASFFDADVGTKTEESVVPENTSEKKIVECPECGEKFPVDSSE